MVESHLLLYVELGLLYETFPFKDLSCDMISIAFIGNFQNSPPSQAMIHTALKFFDDAETMGKLTRNYRINALADFGSTTSPGNAFLELIQQTWQRYSQT